MAFVVVVSGLMVVVAGFMVRSALDHAHSILVCRGLRVFFVVLTELAVVPVETDAPGSDWNTDFNFIMCYLELTMLE